MNTSALPLQPENDHPTLLREQERLRAELRRVEQTKRKFVALTAHEFRNPLAILLGYAKILEDESLGTAKEYAHIVVAQARQLKHLVDAVSTLQQHDLGELALHLDTLALSQVVQDVVARRQQELDERALVAKTQIDATVYVRADRDRLALILTNLISNALKFSPRGGTITIGARVDAHEIIVSVRDQGLGISREEQTRVFERFYQSSDPLTRQHNGLGLGLAVVKVLVESHRGRIWVESAPNQGSVFHFTLPRAARENGRDNNFDPRVTTIV
ncbi:MAG: HAMP domain-containing histidine kinase [Chloroflexi bacterium]|nr:HAMP domain-containing histidine kinase [Chloroflexota bacterium]